MRKILIAAAAVLPMAATAQTTTSVTLYGRFDLSVEHLGFRGTSTRPSSHMTALTSDASLLGFRGSEDLGGGKRAYFKLEHGVSLDTGAAGSAASFWNREAYVGLGDDTLGSVQLGSQWAPGLWQSVRADPFQRFGPGGQYTLMQGSRGYVLRYDNVIKYLSPNIAGLTAQLYGALGEGAVTGRTLAANVDYAQGPLFIGAYLERSNVTAASVGLTGSPVRNRTFSVAATYNFGPAKLHGQFQSNDVDRVPKVDVYLVGVTVPVGQGEIRAAYSHRSANNADASLLGVGYLHFLSKRTHVYTNVARVSNHGTAAFRVGPALGEQAGLGAAGPGAGQGTTAVQVGIRHFF